MENFGNLKMADYTPMQNRHFTQARQFADRVHLYETREERQRVLAEKFESDQWNDFYKFHLSRGTLSEDISQKWAVKNYGTADLVHFFSYSRQGFPLELVEYAISNPDFYSVEVFMAICEENVLEAVVTKSPVYTKSVDAFIRQVSDDKLTNLTFFMKLEPSYRGVDQTGYDLSRIYAQVRKQLDLDDSLPDSWVRKLWLGENPDY